MEQCSINGGSSVVSQGNRRKIIAIDGNIGSGKSTLISELKLRLNNVGFIEEHLEMYTSYKEFNPLAQMYKNPTQNCSITQLHIIRSINDITSKEGPKHQVLITDRSLFSPLVFEDALYKSGYLSTFAKDYISNEALTYADQTLREINAEYIGLFLFDLPVSTCMNRIDMRNRYGEQSIKLDHLRNIKNSYQTHIHWWNAHISSPIEICSNPDRGGVIEQFLAFWKTIVELQ